ncbi:MAG: DUF4432 family protein [Pseudomonadota bacterium]
MVVRVDLQGSLFGETEHPICQSSELSASAFRYPGGVAALRVRNTRGEITVLPYQGQQIWRAGFDGRGLTMRSLFDHPVPTQVYLETYGAFLIHCGLAGLGAPGPGDTHPLHGELPNAPYQTAWLEVSEGKSLSVAGTYQHSVAFSTNYRATVCTTLSAGSALIDVSIEIENLKRTPMDLMYLAHANFLPVDHGELHYTADYTPEAVRVRRSVPAHITPPAGYLDFIEDLARDPAVHHVLRPGLAFDPEAVFEIDPKPDPQGFAHALQRHPDGTADYIRFRPAQTSMCTRWICRTPDQEGIGIAFPSTAGVEGYSAEKAKGRVLTLEGGARWRADITLGLLTAEETGQALETIQRAKAN